MTPSFELLPRRVEIRGHPQAGLGVAPRLARPRDPLGLFPLRHRLAVVGEGDLLARWKLGEPLGQAGLGFFESYAGHGLFPVLLRFRYHIRVTPYGSRATSTLTIGIASMIA